MDEFKPEDELKPDTSDRRPPRQQRGQRLSMPQLALSRQHLMIGIGILVLILLIIGVGSALRSPSSPPVNGAPSQSGSEKNIDLSSSITQNAGSAAVAGGEQPAATGAPQALNAPPVSGTPTQAQVSAPPEGQQRIELPGNMVDALTQQQDQVNAVSQGMTSGSAQPAPSLPSAPATVARPAAEKKVHDAKSSGVKSSAAKNTAAQSKTERVKPAAAAPKAAASVNKPAASGQHGSIQNAPASAFTLQLSGASRSDTLKAYAKQHNLPNAWVYETKRDGKPWFVLVNGVYASSAEAKQAVSALPADVQAKKPWVKPIRQVKQDLNK